MGKVNYTPTQPGEYITGIPARELTAKEFAALPPHLRQAAISTKIYTPSKPKTTKKEATS